jgi:hypothetical protein
MNPQRFALTFPAGSSQKWFDGQAEVILRAEFFGTSPVITLQPVSQSIAVGATATFTSAASGTPAPSGQWQVLKT